MNHVLAHTLLVSALMGSLTGCSDNKVQEQKAESVRVAVESKVHEKIGDGIEIHGDNIRFKNDNLVLKADGQPEALISADGKLTIDGKPVSLTAQHQQLAATLHQQSKQVAADAVNIAGDAVGVASTAMSQGVRMAISSIIKGDDPKREAEFEQKIESTVKERIKPAAIAICKSTNAMQTTRKQLADQVAEFKPYVGDSDRCDPVEIEREFASKETTDHPSSTQ